MQCYTMPLPVLCAAASPNRGEYRGRAAYLPASSVLYHVLQEYETYLSELHRTYPEYWASGCCCCRVLCKNSAARHSSWEGCLATRCFQLSALNHTCAPPSVQVKPIHFGFADNKSMFVSFEGQVNAKTPKFSVSGCAAVRAGFANAVFLLSVVG